MRVDTQLAILASLSGAAAFWRMECRGRVGMARLDPLVNPGVLASHAHAIHGSSGFNEKATYEDLVKGDCTSCAVTEDMSSYWAPNVYFKHADGTFEEVEQVGGMLAYYFLNKDNANPNGKIKAFPNDFRMIAGDASRRNYSISGLNFMDHDPPKALWGVLGQTGQADLEQRAIGFNCLNYKKDPEATLYRHYMPEKAYLDEHCADGVRFEVMFPSCWNGKDTTSPNHKSHVAYPDTVIDGDCPKGFDVKLPGLMYETIWATNAFIGKAGEFVMSHGDIQGFGYHADFISGWEENHLQSAVDQCTNGSGQLSDCPVFTLQSADDQRKCSMKKGPMIANEKLTGKIGNSLPGNVVIQYGPGPAVAHKPVATQATHVPVPSVGYSAGATASSGKDLPGGVFKENPTPNALPQQPSEAPSSSSTPSPTPTPTPTPSEPPVPEGYEVVRTDFITNGNVVSKVVVIETIKYVMVATETQTVTATLGAEKARREFAHLHNHRRHGSH